MEITAQLLRDMIISAANHLENNKQPVNDLNVFPVPDGDTGTNMSMTLGAARAALLGKEFGGADEVAQTVAGALIRGARGNSGVILSLLFRGFSVGFKGHKNVDGKTLAKAAGLGCQGAYKAVMKPAEGTILTVARLSSEAAAKVAEKSDDALKVLTVLYDVACETLAKTPDMLPQLKQAGVVDAGGKGYTLVLEGMLSVLKSGKIITAKEAKAEAPKAAFETFDTASIKFAYCTEFLIEKAKKSSTGDEFRAYLHTIGDCVVVVDADDIIKTHVHTNNPGLVLEAAVKLGTLSKIKIENMKEQHTALLDLPAEAPAKPAKPAKPTREFGFVAVAAGEGFTGVFNDLEVDAVIAGGQTMNPSTQDILTAVEQTPARTVFVLPNNKNIILAAEQCIGLSKKKVVVLPTKTVPQGIAAMLVYDPDADAETNAAAMTEAAGQVTTMSVTYAARDSVFDGMEIKKGNYLGMVEGKVQDVEVSLKDCLDKMAAAGLKGTESYINIFYGEGVDEKDAEDAKSILAAHLPETAEINLINGGQPVYYYVISAE